MPFVVSDLSSFLFFLPGCVLDIPSDASHTGTLLVCIAQPIPIVRDMDLILRQLPQTLGTRSAWMSGRLGFCNPDAQLLC